MRFFFLCFCSALICCQPKQTTTHFQHYNFDSLFDRQLQIIARTKPVLYKKIFFQNKVDSICIKLDSNQWKLELENFRQMESINKPMYAGLYQREITDDLHSNLNIVSFKTRAKLPVSSVRFFVGKNKPIIYKIESTMFDGNALFETSRTASLEFDNIDQKTILVAYTLKQVQKTVLGKNESFIISGKIHHQIEMLPKQF